MNEFHTERGGYKEEVQPSHRDERRRLLILATYQLIAEKGFEHLRTRDIATKAGVNVATLHYYFGSKEDLIPGVVEHLIHEFSTQVPAIAAEMEGTTPLDRLRAMFLATYCIFGTKPEVFIVLSEIVLRSLRDVALQPALKRLDEEWNTYLQFIIVDGVRQGVFRPDLDPVSMSAGLIAMIKGFSFHRITSPNALNIDQMLNNVERLLLP